MPPLTDRRVFVAQTAALATAATLSTAVGLPAAPMPQPPAGDWWRWRGPTGQNHAAKGNTLPPAPLQDHVRWVCDIPGRGHSSPILVDGAAYLTTADTRLEIQSVIKISADGVIDWMLPVHRGGLPTENHPKNTEATPSLAYDGQSFYATFYNRGAIYLTKIGADGSIIWQTNIGGYSPQQYKYGYAASPLLHQDNIIVVGDFDGAAFLAAIDRQSGREVWKVDRPGRITFSSPIVADVAGRPQMILSGGDQVASYDPHTGRLNWRAADATTMATCGTVVWDDTRIYASGGYPKSETVAVAGDGSARVVWSNPVKCYEQSMLAVDGYVYAIADAGVAYCWRGEDGKMMWRQRLGGNYSSSPILVGDTIHVFNESGEGYAFAASPSRYQTRGESKVGDEVFASPVVAGNTMYLRVANNTPAGRQESLLAIG